MAKDRTERNVLGLRFTPLGKQQDCTFTKATDHSWKSITGSVPIPHKSHKTLRLRCVLLPTPRETQHSTISPSVYLWLTHMFRVSGEIKLENTFVGKGMSRFGEHE